MASSSGKRYAQVAFTLASEHGGLQNWVEDFDRAKNIFNNSDVQALLSAPQVPDKVKLDGIGTLMKDFLPMVRNTLSVIVLRGDLGIFERMVEVFCEMVDSSRGLVKAEVKTAVPLDESQKNRVKNELSELLDVKHVDLVEKVDPAILGGLITKVGDRLIDGSTRSRLQKLKQELADGPRA